MNARILFVALQCLIAVRLAADTNSVAIYPEADPLTPENYVIAWPSTPGVRYEVRQSTDLESWTVPEGFPAVANGPAQQMPILADGLARFFQVVELDEQAPAIAGQYPQEGSFAVPRFSKLTLQLSDVTGIDTNSIQLTVGDLGTFALGTPKLTFTNNVLTFDNGGSVALGPWGTNVQASLVVADTLGNRGTNTWRFDLEVNPQVVTNLFVFGSPQALRMGQRLPNTPTAALATRQGPIPMDGPAPWKLEAVGDDSVVLSYTDTRPPIFAETYIGNLTPTTVDEIFCRKVMSVSDDPANKRMTLLTTNVDFAEIVIEGSEAISTQSVIYEVGDNGVILRALSYDNEILLEPIGVTGRWPVFDVGGVTLTLKEGTFRFTPSMALSFETRSRKLQRLTVDLHGQLETALVPELRITGSLAGTQGSDLFSKSRVVFLGSVGLVPVWLHFKFTLGAEVGYNLAGNATMSTGVRQNAELGFSVDYVKDRSPSVTLRPTFVPETPDLLPFTYEVNGAASAYAVLTPQIDVRVNSLAGVYANLDPRVDVSGTATVNNGEVSSASFRIVARANLNVGMSVIGLGNEQLPDLDPLNLFHWEWSTNYPPPDQLTIRIQPKSQDVVVGSSVSFSVDAVSDQPITYQWYFNEGPMAGNTGPILHLYNVSLGHAGDYHVRLSSGGQVVKSDTATLTVRSPDDSTHKDMVLIPAGSFTMGDTFNEVGEGWISEESPTHEVYVSAFYMDRYEVTKALWDQVYQWAITHGYTFDSPGDGKGANYPMYYVSWPNAVKWCNARSEREGLVPAYYTSPAQTTVYRTGAADLGNEWVRWDRGYRLPTEAEWEKAARGGLSGRRFPWGDTITHSQANYESIWSSGLPILNYDLSTTQGFHPTFGVGNQPYASPVGSFAPNGYGLYDMAGNMWEWCWDLYGRYSSESVADPRGPSWGVGWYRVVRGGSWFDYASFLRVSVRGDTQWPAGWAGGGIDFRSVLPFSL